MKRRIRKVNLVVMDQPENPVMNGKNRWKFPSSKDCYVRIGIFDHVENDIQGKNFVPVCYEQQPYILKSKKNGAQFLLEITCITRHPVDESSLIDVPLHMVCLQRPLNFWKLKKHTNDDFGFWFRFFGKSCRFHITISLKEILQNGQAICDQEGKIIDTVEFDIVNFEGSDGRKITRHIKKPSHTTSLYSEKGYVHIMQELETLFENCLWQECRSVGVRLLSELDETKYDYKVCILLVQSKAACQQGELKDAKFLIKKALDMLPAKSKNKELLIGRAYICLSLSHQYDMAFGNAEECLRIAKTKLLVYVPCEDTGDFYYQEGKILLGFIFKLSTTHIKLFNEAQEKFEKAESHFRECHNWKKTGIMNKIHSAQLYTAMLLLLGKKGDDTVVVVDQIMSSMTEIHAMLSYKTKCIFNFAKAMLMEQKSDFNGVQVNGKAALDLAIAYGLYLEEQWIKTFLKRFPKPGNEG